ncbi:MAG TPA: hypothetical protein VM935_02300, partial [Chitinophagaceae bacterium]|nr:hypothetical protein [Chitinophagaceae bacterium]
MKFREIYSFEIWYQLRRPTTWLYFLAILGLICMTVDEMVEYARTVNPVLLNAPITVAAITGYANKFGLLLIAALAGDGAMRDIHARMDPLLYTTSIRKATYLGARFLGSVSAAAVLMSLAVPAGLSLAAFTMSIETELLGPLLPGAYINSALFLTLPNVFIATTIMYASALLLRHSMAAYLGGFIIFILSTFNLEMAAGNWKLAELIDPSGITIIDEISSTLTPVELNTKLVALKGYLLANRVLWVAIS